MLQILTLLFQITTRVHLVISIALLLAYVYTRCTRILWGEQSFVGQVQCAHINRVRPSYSILWHTIGDAQRVARHPNLRLSEIYTLRVPT